MGLFSKCSRCGKKKLSFFIGSDGLCSDCHTIAWQEKGAEITRNASMQNLQKRDDEKFEAVSETQLYYEQWFEFNTHWVSLDYPANMEKTANIICKLHCGDPIILKWSNTPFRDKDYVKVFTQTQKQIGWVPGPYPELERAVKNRWSIDAHIKRTGKVQEPGKNIWWAVIEGTIKVPCAPGTKMVYMTSYKSRYHLREDCGKAYKRKMPLSEALELGGIPCPHCAVSDEEQK